MSDKIKAELLAIQKASKDSMLHAESVVAWAKRNRKSALHREFEWNNSRAAAEFRLWQARRLIQITIITEDGKPQLVSLSYDRPRGGGYRTITDVVSNRELSSIMLEDALGELQRVQMRFRQVQELTRVWVEIDLVAKKKATQNGRSKVRKAA